MGDTYDLDIVLRALVLAGVLSLAVGCAGPAAELRRTNAQLDRDLADARAELRKERRKTHDLETENVVLRDKLGGGARADDDVPRLPVEVVTPDDAPAEASAGDDDLGDGARVVGTDADGNEIVYVGDAADGDSVDAGDFDLGGDDGDDLEYAPDDDDVAPPPRAKPAAAKKPKKVAAQPDSGAAAAYQAAVAKVKAHEHDGAVTALRAFLDAYPKDDLSDNAQYWLGEVYYDEKDWARAVVEFRATVDGYPKGNKVPDALLKLGYCFAQLGQDAKARTALQEVVDAYPGTQPARLASARLEELR